MILNYSVIDFDFIFNDIQFSKVEISKLEFSQRNLGRAWENSDYKVITDMVTFFEKFKTKK